MAQCAARPRSGFRWVPLELMALLDITGDVTRLAEPTQPGERLSLALTAGPVEGRLQAAVAWLVVEGGRGDLAIDGIETGVRGLDDVFATTGCSAFLAPGSTFTVRGDLRTTLVWCAYDGSATSRVIEPRDVVEEERGAGANLRRVRTYLPSGPIIAGETLNPAGLWSSYPPHKHDTDSETESRHEELYRYRFDPPGGFGLALRYDDEVTEPTVVRDGDISRITSGYHPVVAAPGYEMYYLWALAGDRHELRPALDPAHAWLA